MGTKSGIKFIRQAVTPLGVISVLTLPSMAFAGDPVNPVGWTSNIQLGAPLPQGFYFIDTATYLDRSGSNLSPGLSRVNAVVNIPAFAWSTPIDFLGGHLEILTMIPELNVDLNPGGGPGSASYRAFYNPTGYVGEAWDLGGGFSISNFVGGFIPVNTSIGTLGLGGNFWTFVDIAGVAYNENDWSLSANFYYSHSGNNLDTGIHAQPDTFTVDFAAVRHIGKWELGLVGNAGTDVSDTLGNDWGGHPFSEVSLGGLAGYTFGPVTAELYAERSIEARNQTAGGCDTQVWGRIVVPLWKPQPAASIVAKY